MLELGLGYTRNPNPEPNRNLTTLTLILTLTCSNTLQMISCILDIIAIFVEQVRSLGVGLGLEG